MRDVRFLRVWMWLLIFDWNTVLALVPLNTRSFRQIPHADCLHVQVSTGAATKTATSAVSTSSSSFQEEPPKAKSWELRLSELYQRHATGEELSQSYCDSVLASCVANDEWDSVLSVLEIMKQRGLFIQERSMYRACLQACFELGNGSAAEEILRAMEQASVIPESTDIGLVVMAMCRNDKSDQKWSRRAYSLLLQERDCVVPVQAYEAVLSCLNGRQWKEAVRLLREMEAESSNRHPKPSLAVYRAAIESCVAASQAEQALRLLVNMSQTPEVEPTTYIYELVLGALSKKGQWRRALDLLNSMSEDVVKTVLIFNSVISACAKAGEVGMAKNLLDRMRRDYGIRPNVVSYNSVISACAATSRWRDALSLLDQCQREGVTPDIYTYTNAIRACVKGRKTERALNLFEVVKAKNLPVDAYCYTAVIDACAKARVVDWKKALELLEEMKAKGIEPSGVTYSVAITACGNGGQWKTALELLEQMRERGMQINLITYNSAISALSKASRRNAKFSADVKEELWPIAMRLISQMRADGQEPDGFSYSSAISCCGAEGRWQEALELMQNMKKGGPRTRPNKIAYTAAIAACGRSGEHEKALELFRDMKNEGLSADRVAYNAVFSALRVANKADEAYDLWGEMSGKTSTDTTAIATTRPGVEPDIITLTELVAVLSRSEDPTNKNDRVDEVFAEAVERGLVFHGERSLDLQWEVDLSGFSFPVARAACRFILNRAIEASDAGKETETVIFITGVGSGKTARWREEDQTKRKTSLREYVQEVLRHEMVPPLNTDVPKFAEGTVEISKDSLKEWIAAQ